ncbi:Endoglucanase EG-II [Taxawa tesnikishii (nom. ined.)]|nr:Endoglucanase EG-II [Dothideales sp. JES 119]
MSLTSRDNLVDIHNYARWDGGIIGQGGPSDADFASVWSQLATAYANESRIAFGLMNEPHDVPDIIRWSQSVQAAVTAIRNAGATSQYILMPGNNYTSAMAFVENGSGPALLNVTNPASSGLSGYERLIFDVHSK